MRFFGKKIYREVTCLACAGKGKVSPVSVKRENTEGPAIIIQKMFERESLLVQGICLACKGRGTQTVLEREE